MLLRGEKRKKRQTDRKKDRREDEEEEKERVTHVLSLDAERAVSYPPPIPPV